MKKLIAVCAFVLLAAGCNSNSGAAANSHNNNASNNTVGASETSDLTNRNPAALNNPNGTNTNLDANAVGAGASGTQATAPAAGQPSAQAAGAMGGTSQMSQMMTSQLALNRLHAINQEEIEAGKMAEKNGGKDVQGFGKELVKDHQMLDKQVSTVAQKVKVQLQDPSKVQWPQPVQQDMQSGKQMMGQLKNMKGKQFDQQFLTMMVAGHTKARDYLKELQSSAQDEQVKQLATQAAPTIQKHLTTAQNLVNKTGARLQGRR